ncbi:MAG: undecaprenyl-diphosphate phosphatase [Oscillospiraceae bacterium]|nr:undecaprenyl-diphosphate phosphatase [Oscillospiraceae bacterium]
MSIFLGFVQGVAEFLPISSSGHLSIFQNFLNVQTEGPGNMFFDVLLHLGTLVAVIIVYHRDVWGMIKQLFCVIGEVVRLKPKDQNPPPTRRMLLLLVIATIPLVIIVPFNDRIAFLSDSTVFVGCALLVTGILLFVSDRVKKGNKNAKTAKVLDALIVGISQCFATVPGISRSGTTIATGLFRGLDREFAVKLSFLMSIPAVLGAGVLSIADAVREGINTELLGVYAIGFVTSIFFGYISIKLVDMIVKKGKFGGFSYYCWAVGILTIVLSFVL